MSDEIDYDLATPATWINNRQVGKISENHQLANNLKRTENYQINSKLLKNETLPLIESQLKYKNITDSYFANNIIKSSTLKNKNGETNNFGSKKSFCGRPISTNCLNLVKNDYNSERIEYGNIQLYEKVRTKLREAINKNLIMAIFLFWIIEWILMGITVQILRGRSKKSVEINLHSIVGVKTIILALKFFVLRMLQLLVFYRNTYLKTDYPTKFGELISRIMKLEVSLIWGICLRAFAIYFSLLILKNELFYFADSNQESFYSFFQMLIICKLLIFDTFKIKERSYESLIRKNKIEICDSLKTLILKNFLFITSLFLGSVVLFLSNKLVSSNFLNSKRNEEAVNSIISLVFILKLVVGFLFTILLTDFYDWILRIFIDVKIDRYMPHKNRFEDLLYLLREIQAKNKNFDFENFKIEKDLINFVNSQIEIYKRHFCEISTIYDDRADFKSKNLKQLVSYFANEFKHLNNCFEFHVQYFSGDERPLFETIFEGFGIDHRFSICKKLEGFERKIDLLNELIYLNENAEVCRNEMRELINAMDLLRISMDKYFGLKDWQIENKGFHDTCQRFSWNLDLTNEKLVHKHQGFKYSMTSSGLY